MDSNDDNEPPEPTLDGERSLPIRRDGDELVINTSEAAINAINDLIDERDERAEITFLTAIRKVIRHAQAPWFDETRAIDEEPVEPRDIDEEALEEELKELEGELAEEREDTIDKNALGEELADIWKNLPQEIREDLTDEELRELVVEIHKEKEAIETAIEIDTSELLQDDGDGEEE